MLTRLPSALLGLFHPFLLTHLAIAVTHRTPQTKPRLIQVLEHNVPLLCGLLQAVEVYLLDAFGNWVLLMLVTVAGTLPVVALFFHKRRIRSALSVTCRCSFSVWANC